MVQVSLHPYNPDWAKRFSKEKAALERILGPYYFEIAHIGSTSIPGLVSKDIIDILIQLEPFPDPKELDLLLDSLEYRRKEVFSMEEYLYYTRGDRLTGYHLHITVKEHPSAQVHLKFRDILIESDSVRKEYASVKEELSLRYAMDRAAYRRVIHRSQNSYGK
jgi:GrpB-like predicted nucleotidyltransferase (UPF0157 family)